MGIFIILSLAHNARKKYSPVDGYVEPVHKYLDTKPHSFYNGTYTNVIHMSAA